MPVVTTKPCGEVFQPFTLDVVTQEDELRRCEEHRLLDAGVRKSPALTWVGRHHAGPHGGVERSGQEAVLVGDRLTTTTELLLTHRAIVVGALRM
jgi:hypothetical protein